MNENDESPFGTFDARFGEHSNWTIEATPTRVGQLWQANAIATRAPTEDGDDEGDRFEFHDLGECATEDLAATRAIEWVTHWIEVNH